MVTVERVPYATIRCLPMRVWPLLRLSLCLMISVGVCAPTVFAAPRPQRNPAARAVAGPASTTVDRTAFETNLHAAIAPKVMGYSFILMKAGLIVGEGAGGLARSPADGALKMTTATPQNLGSLMKFITGVAVLHMLDDASEVPAGGANSLDTRLDASIALLWPNDWLQAPTGSPAIRSLTFRELLGHRSGLGDCNVAIGCIAGNYDRSNLTRRYANANYTWLGYMIPLYLDPSLKRAFDDLRTKNVMKADDRNRNMELVLGDRMMRYFNNHLFKLVPGNIRVSCDAANEFKATGAYGYASKNDTGPGIITSRQAGRKPCSGAGGNWMSVRDFAAFTAYALHGDKILSRKAKDRMFREGLDPDDRLVWSFLITNGWIRDRFGMDPIIWSNGIQPYGTGQSFNTVLLRLPNEHQLMVFTNSGGMSVTQLAQAGMAAFRAGVEAAAGAKR